MSEFEGMRAPFRLVNGRLIDVIAIDPKDIEIEVIAVSLAKLARYGGQTSIDRPNWVAVHSVMVSYLVPNQFAYEGLMHDYTEAIACVDVPSPIKKLCPDYRRIEHHVRSQTHRVFSLAEVEPAPVKYVDVYVARPIEQLFLQGVELPTEITNTDVEIGRPFVDREWTPREAYRLFMDRYDELRPRLN